MKRLFLFVAWLALVAIGSMADIIKVSTTLPSEGRPEHLYTMANGRGNYADAQTAPANSADDYGLFAFYAVSGKTNAYNIFSYKANKWLIYTKAASYDNGKGFVRLSNSRLNNYYFVFNNYEGNYYEVSPVTSAGTTDKYLNWFGGVAANEGTALGLWKDSGSADDGSRWVFAEVDFKTYDYLVSLPDGGNIYIGGEKYANGDTYTCEGAITAADISVPTQKGKFSALTINNENEKIIVRFVDVPSQPATDFYTGAAVYPMQQDNVGAASLVKDVDVYTLSNRVLAASFVKVGDALFFGGSKAMSLEAGTEIFTMSFGSGTEVGASSMTLKSLEMVDLAGDPNAVGGAEHYNGKALVAKYEYTYNNEKADIVWRAVLRDGSHYLRSEMEITGVGNVDMYNVIPLLYNVNTKSAGTTPAVVGNTRGAVILSDKIFAGLENPVAYNTVGGAAGEDDAWQQASASSDNLTATSWTTVAESVVPLRVTEATGASYPDVLAYTKSGVELKEGQKIEVTLTYKSGNHRLNLGGADLLDGSGNVAANDYHSGYTGTQKDNNTFTMYAPYDGTFDLRIFIEKKTEAVDAASVLAVDVYSLKEGVVVNKEIVGIQGLWSRNTTLAAGETWKISGVVGLVAQDGRQSDSNISNTQKRRSFLAYSERERAVPWRANPAYISWYELNINRNNAADPTQNMNANQVLDVLNHWKSDFYDVYGVGPCSFVIDDGWDNYGTWTFHAGFPNEMRDIAKLASEMAAGVGAWLG
ncbi:MAG: hypothetical protein ACI4TS_06420, partial [Bacteroidaceae bacterium]